MVTLVKVTENISKKKRVDKYLAEKYPDFSRRYFQDGLKDEKVLVNGTKKLSSYKLKEGDEIEINLSLKRSEKIVELPINKKVEFEIVAKYPDFFIINKPVGLIVHPSIFDVQNNSIPPTLAGGLLALDKNLKNVGEDILDSRGTSKALLLKWNEMERKARLLTSRSIRKDITRPGIVHRLDKDTSGLMIIPRTQKVFKEFKRQFKNQEVSKTYVALCWNMQTQKDKLKLSSANKIKYSKITRLIGKSKNEHTKQSTNKNPKYLINPKEATTLYAMIQAGQFPCNYRVNNINKEAVPLALIQAKPQTGRKHQVRVHLSSVGLPLVGDKKYTSKVLKNCNKNFKHHLLHAYKLNFIYQGKKYSFTSDLPKYFEELMR